MIKEHLPVDHNDTHRHYPRTLYEAFQGHTDLSLYEPQEESLFGEDSPFVTQLLVIALVSLIIFLVWG
jgi:hypothetical protein